MRSMKRGARVYTCMGAYERHEAWTEKGGDGKCVCMWYVDIAREVYRLACVEKKELWRPCENDPKKINECT